MNNRVFLLVVFAKIANHRLHIGVIQQFNDIGDSQFIKVEPDAFLIFLRPPTWINDSINSLRNGLVCMCDARSSNVFLVGSVMRADSNP